MADGLNDGKGNPAVNRVINKLTSGAVTRGEFDQFAAMADKMEENRPIPYDRLGALGALNAKPKAAQVDTGESIPYDYSQRQQMYPALPAPEAPSGRNVLVNDTDPQLTRPEQVGDRETAINVEQRKREQVDSDRKMGITPLQRVRMNRADRRFIDSLPPESREHGELALAANEKDPDLTTATLDHPDIGPKAERSIFEAITDGRTNDARNIIDGYGPAEPAAKRNNPESPEKQDQRGSAEAGTEGTGAPATPDNRNTRVNPFHLGGKWPHELHGLRLHQIARSSKSLVDRAKAKAEIERRNPNREFDRAAHDARKRLWRTIVQAGGISEKEAADIGIDPRSLGGYRMSGLFTPNGMRADILARTLAESGYLNPRQMQDGGDEALLLAVK